MRLRSGKLVADGPIKKHHPEPVLEIVDSDSDESFSDSDEDMVEQSITRGLSVKPFVDLDHPALEAAPKSWYQKLWGVVLLALVATGVLLWAPPDGASFDSQLLGDWWQWVSQLWAGAPDAEHLVNQ